MNPGESTPTSPSTTLSQRGEEAAQAAARLDREADAWWRELVPGVDPPPLEARWVTGGVPGSVRRETTHRLYAAPRPVSAILAAAAAGLGARRAGPAGPAARSGGDGPGWRVEVPSTGVPRVLASAGSGASWTELHLVHSPGDDVLVLRIRSVSVTVRGADARALVGGGAR